MSGWIVSGDEEPAEQTAGDSAGSASAPGSGPPGSVAPGSAGAPAAGPAETGEAEHAEAETVGVDGAAEEARSDEAAAGDANELSNGALVLLGVLGGLYLLYAWIWLGWAQFYAEMNAAVAAGSGSLGSALQQVLFWAAPTAPILWFLAALLLNRGAGMRRIAIWLIVGAVVLLPYPIFSGGGAS